MSEKKITHGPKGAIGGVADIREYATLDGNPIGEGENAKHSVTLPPWFSRTGRNHFVIDSGFGIVKCRAVAADDEDYFKILGSKDDAKYHLIVDALVALPDDWVIEEECEVGPMVFKEGEALPPVSDVRGNADACRDYVRRILPPSLITQIVTGQRYASIPPIRYTPASPR